MKGAFDDIELARGGSVEAVAAGEQGAGLGSVTENAGGRAASRAASGRSW